MHKWFDSPMHVSSSYLFCDRRTIFYLVLQVYCSPTLKEYVHNPAMTVLACNVERTVSILCVHGVVHACVCVVLCP